MGNVAESCLSCNKQNKENEENKKEKKVSLNMLSRSNKLEIKDKFVKDKIFAEDEKKDDLPTKEKSSNNS